MEDLAYDLVRNAVKVKYDDLPGEVVEITKKFILDTLATMVAGSTASGCSGVVEQMKDWGGKEESTIMIYGGKVPAPGAALCNSMMAHAMDFDDTHDTAVLHANVSVLPAALAVAERKGKVSGKEFITAVAVGIDLMCRLGLGAIGSLIWVLSSTTGYFGATAAVGKILGLDEKTLHHALGIAYSQCAGSLQTSADGALVKRMQPAFAARAAIISSIFAQRGITGTRNIFEGSSGFFPVYQRGNYDRNKVLQGLGKVFEGANLGVKLYPCCRYTHSCIDASLAIMHENDINPDDVVEVIAHVTEDIYHHVGRPFEIGESPQVDAQFSVPYTTAVAITRRDVSIDDFMVENIKSNKKVIDLAMKVKVVVDQESIAKGLTPCVVEIKTRDNKVYSHRVEILRGDPRKPASMEDIAQKFRKCTAFSALPISEGKAGEIIGEVSNLEAAPDISKIIDMLSPR